MSDYFENHEEQLRCEEQLTSKLFRRIAKLEAALERIRDCDFVITLPDRMDAVRQIAREALEL